MALQQPFDNLNYGVHNDTLYLASEIKALFAAGVPARWDHEYFYQHATGPAMSDRTLFEGVHQVPGARAAGPKGARQRRIDGLRGGDTLSRSQA